MEVLTQKEVQISCIQCAQSHHCRNCDEYFTPDRYEDERESYLGSPTSTNKREWESDEEYRDRMEDWGIDPD